MRDSRLRSEDATSQKAISFPKPLARPRQNPESLASRIMDDDGSDTFRSVHGGAVAFGQGCFRAMRNVLSHEMDAAQGD